MSLYLHVQETTETGPILRIVRLADDYLFADVVARFEEALRFEGLICLRSRDGSRVRVALSQTHGIVVRQNFLRDHQDAH
jgi:hypothetical protein